MNTRTAYDDCLRAMFGLHRFGIILGLDTIRRLLAGLGDPHTAYRTVHVAGTNGKGSIAAALASILTTCGYKTGLYSSPHLVRFNERICVDGRQIDDEAVVSAYNAVKAVPRQEREPTFFEYATAMALHQFAEQKVDFAVIETGMGGRLDATNIIDPVLSIITNISVEHAAYLGTTIEAIANEKGGIIKPGTPVVTGVRQKSAIAAIREIARTNSAPYFRLGEHFRIRRTSKRNFNYYGIKNVWRNLATPLAGAHQIENTALTLAACECLSSNSVDLPPEGIQSGLTRTKWPGRLDVVSHRPLVILDGAHNLMAAKKLGQYLKQELHGRNISLVVGILDDKPYKEMLAGLLPHCKSVVLTRPRIDRALPAETLRAIAENRPIDITVIPDVRSAFKYALEHADPKDAVCVAGSLYVVGEAMEALEGGELNHLLNID